MFPLSLSRQDKGYSAHQEQLVVLRFQEEKDYANARHNPLGSSWWSLQFSSEIMARGDVDGWVVVA
jgi:hypothetical protein